MFSQKLTLVSIFTDISTFQPARSDGFSYAATHLFRIVPSFFMMLSGDIENEF